MRSVAFISLGVNVFLTGLFLMLTWRFFHGRSHAGPQGYNRGRAILHLAIAISAAIGLHVASATPDSATLVEWCILFALTMAFAASAIFSFSSVISIHANGVCIPRIMGTYQLRNRDFGEVVLRKGEELDEQGHDRIELRLVGDKVINASGWSNLEALAEFTKAHEIPIKGDLKKFAMHRKRSHTMALAVIGLAIAGNLWFSMTGSYRLV